MLLRIRPARRLAIPGVDICKDHHSHANNPSVPHVPPRLVGPYNKGKRYRMQVDVWGRWGELIAGFSEGGAANGDLVTTIFYTLLHHYFARH